MEGGGTEAIRWQWSVPDPIPPFQCSLPLSSPCTYATKNGGMCVRRLIDPRDYWELSKIMSPVCSSVVIVSAPQDTTHAFLAWLQGW